MQNSKKTLEYLDDPLFLLDKTLPHEDFEVLSFLVAGLSYGRVEQIKASCYKLFDSFTQLNISSHGLGLKKFLCQPNLDFQHITHIFSNFKHRMNTASDLAEIFIVLSNIFKHSRTLCEHYQKKFHPDSKTQLLNFIGDFESEYSQAFPSPKRSTKKWKGTGATWFFSNPAKGGTSKRFLMWMRWMVREDNIDPGLWQKKNMFNPKLPRPLASRLFIPVDTHIFNWARSEKIVLNKSPTWKSVEQITRHLQKICPEDPCKFDFELCHKGMSKFRNSP